MSADVAASIDVQLVNPQGEPTAYAGKANTMTLILTNRTGAAISVQPGTPAHPPPSGGPFAFEAYFDRFYVNPGDESAVSIAAPGWAADYFSGPYPAWSVAANEARTWNDGTQLWFTVGNFDPTVAVGTYYVKIVIYNLAAQTTLVSVPIGVANPPQPGDGDLSTVVGLELDSTEVLITKRPDEPIENALKIRLFNKSPNAPVVPSDVPWGPRPPKFTLSFVYADAPPGWFALTTTDVAAQFGVGLSGGGGWSVAPPSPGPVWALNPDPVTNHAILGVGPMGIAEFTVTNVLTQFAPGPTLLYLNYTDVPGYKDGSLACILDKEYGQMVIDQFKINQTVFPVHGSEVQYGYLNWRVRNASLVQLSGVGPVPSQASAYEIPVERNTTFVLTAYDVLAGAVSSSSQQAQLAPSMSTRLLPCGAICAWAGAVADLPPGWGVCDGTRGTPDLRDRFIVGAGGLDAPNTSGEPTHRHPAAGSFGVQTSSDGQHTHGMPTAWFARNLSSGSKYGIDTRDHFNTNVQTQGAGTHSHSATIAYAINTDVNTGGLRPRWYALCYAMKLFP